MNIFGQNTRSNSEVNLTKAGIKVTPARTAVAKYLGSINKPVDVDTITNEVRKKDEVNTVTIYRILDIFLSKGIIKRIELGEGKYRYELAGSHHHHLICTNCGNISDVEGEYLKDMEDKIRSKKGFLVKSHSLEFFGLCRNCQH
jgi:Fur family ferric uptake transcriptional regulator